MGGCILHPPIFLSPSQEMFPHYAECEVLFPFNYLSLKRSNSISYVKYIVPSLELSSGEATRPILWVIHSYHFIWYYIIGFFSWFLSQGIFKLALDVTDLCLRNWLSLVTTASSGNWICKNCLPTINANCHIHYTL